MDKKEQKQVKKRDKKVEKLVKLIAKKHKIKDKQKLRFEKSSEGELGKVICCVNLLELFMGKGFPNWKIENGKLIYSDSVETFEVKVEYKPLEDVRTASDIMYTLMADNQDKVFRLTDDGRINLTNGALDSLNLDTLKSKGFVFEGGYLVNHDVLINEKPVMIEIIADGNSINGEKIDDYTSGQGQGEVGSRILDNATSTAPENLSTLTSEQTIRTDNWANANTISVIGGLASESSGSTNFNFYLMKEVFLRYGLKVINEKLVAYDKDTGEIVQDKEIIDNTKLAHSWYEACTGERSGDPNSVRMDEYDEQKVDFAFVQCESEFESMLNIIRSQMSGGHGLDIERLIVDIRNNPTSKDSVEIIHKLFHNPSSKFTEQEREIIDAVKEAIVVGILDYDKVYEHDEMEQDNAPVMEMVRENNNSSNNY